jgi:magnesium chelatase subunit I
MGEETPIAWLTPRAALRREAGHARRHHRRHDRRHRPHQGRPPRPDISDELTIHYGLLPRANRGIFAINELPDLAGKIQVGLFNIMQEGDVQIKGYPVRLPLDVMLVFTANPEDYTARGKIITPLKDRIGSEIRTHYPLESSRASASPAGGLDRTRFARGSRFPPIMREVVEQIAFARARGQAIDKRSGVSAAAAHHGARKRRLQCRTPRLLNRATTEAVPRVADLYAALPSITGKLELEYEGELKGGDSVARELIRAASWPASIIYRGRPGHRRGGSRPGARRLLPPQRLPVRLLLHRV